MAQSKNGRGHGKIVTQQELAEMAGQYMQLLVLKARRQNTKPGEVIIKRDGRVMATLTPIKCGSKSITAVLSVAVET